MKQTTVRYFVTDVDEAVDFYCSCLGFHVDLPGAPGFAGLAKDDLRLFLHEPGAGGAAKPVGFPSPEDGIGSRSSLPISTRPLSASLLRGEVRGEITEDLAAARSSSRIQRATWSALSAQEALSAAGTERRRDEPA